MGVRRALATLQVFEKSTFMFLPLRPSETTYPSLSGTLASASLRPVLPIVCKEAHAAANEPRPH